MKTKHKVRYLFIKLPIVEYNESNVKLSKYLTSQLLVISVIKFIVLILFAGQL